MTTKLLIDRELLPCPFCGDRPELPSGEGTQYEIECSGCGQAMASVQICDLMSVEERAADSFTNYRYADEFVERAKKQAIESWNTRAAPATVQGDGWIPIIERLPNVAQEVIIFSGFEGVCAGVLDSYGEWFAPCSEYKLTRVTHWMPLPAAPEVKP